MRAPGCHFCENDSTLAFWYSQSQSVHCGLSFATFCKKGIPQAILPAVNHFFKCHNTVKKLFKKHTLFKNWLNKWKSLSFYWTDKNEPWKCVVLWKLQSKISYLLKSLCHLFLIVVLLTICHIGYLRRRVVPAKHLRGH